MEFFTQAKFVRLRSHHNKFLVAGDDGESVKQSRHGHTRKARWAVEPVRGKPNTVRLRSCYNRLLTTSDEPFLLGWTGKKVLQTVQTDCNTSAHWEPIRDQIIYVQLWAPLTGKYLRANGGSPPWRNSVTVDVPERTATRSWILWTVDVVDDDVGGKDDQCVWPRKYKSLTEAAANDIVGSCSSSSSVEEDSLWDETEVSESADSPKSSSSPYKSGMELFQNAKTVRLRSHHDKYLLADDDQDSVCQDRHGGSQKARWSVEYVKSVEGVALVRFKSCYDKYLTATDDEFFMGVTGKKVRQMVPRRLDSSIEWEPIRDGMQIRLKTRYGNFLRANGGVPPWRNSITHDVPSRSHTQDWILWEVEVLEFYERKPKVEMVEKEKEKEKELDRCESEVEPFEFKPLPHGRSQSAEFAASGVKHEGRVIHYNVVDDDGNIVEGDYSIVFKGNGVEELTQKLEEETGLADVTVCSRNPLNGKLYPMRLDLPPNHVKLHVYVVPSSSTAAAEFVTN